MPQKLRSGRKRRDAGFTLVELLVTMALFLVMFGGVHGFFLSTSALMRRGDGLRPVYEVGLALVDSITRDARGARDMTGTAATLISGTHDANITQLIFNYPARQLTATSWAQKRITYKNETSAGGGCDFKRIVETGETGAATTTLSPAAINYVRQEWLLTHYVHTFQFEKWDSYTSGSSFNKRICRFFLGLRSSGASDQYRLNGRAWIRRVAPNDNVPSTVSF